MNGDLQEALRSDLALVSLENHLIQRARVLHQMGFFPSRISPSQMSAVAERIRTVPGLAEAKDKVESFLRQQLKKLMAQAERTGQPESWAIAPRPGAGEQTLGHTLIRWIVEEKYLPDEMKDLNRLHALRRFWDRFHGFYRYEVEMHHSMSLHPLTKEME